MSPGFIPNYLRSIVRRCKGQKKRFSDHIVILDRSRRVSAVLKVRQIQCWNGTHTEYESVQTPEQQVRELARSTVPVLPDRSFHRIFIPVPVVVVEDTFLNQFLNADTVARDRYGQNTSFRCSFLPMKIV